ncbi:YdcH family protein [Asticcacaulis sp. YBE204]|uniref:YdcH family protein n=1 Tax=Asticcacaulis sp. YBE204 TaxID=1282363 RepID=UPI0003C3F3A6|nr:DUF465 domain-containing protein [Asticcacaulis sp. YBE204]ESQ79967.1 hypothetical protein AEYBE204_08960 [Asticcacaulis sp. YBE204]
MHDDNNIRALFRPDSLQLVKNTPADANGDVERRVGHREELDKVTLELVSEEIVDTQPDDLEPAYRELDNPVSSLPINAETVALRAQAALLKQEHKDLDDSIHALETMPMPDQILIARLKRKKLALRDQITTLEDRIRPDIIA